MLEIYMCIFYGCNKKFCDKLGIGGYVVVDKELVIVIWW